MMLRWAGWVACATFIAGTAYPAPAERTRRGVAEELVSAAASGDLAAVESLIRRGADVNATHENETPLGAATRHGRAEVVRGLLDAKAKPQSARGRSRDERTTLLNAAAASGDLATFELIRPLSPDPKAADGSGRTALHAVGMSFAFPEGKDHAAIVDALLAAGLDPHAKMPKDDYSADLRLPIDTPLRVAAAHGEPAVVAALAKRVVYQPAELTFILSLAVRTCPADVLETLIDRGADVNGRGSAIDIAPPLYTAAWRKHHDAARLFLRRGADPNRAENGGGRTPLHVAVAAGQPELVAVLLDGGADPSLKDKDGHDAFALLRIRKEKGREGPYRNGPRHPELAATPDAPAGILRLLERPRTKPAPAGNATK